MAIGGGILVLLGLVGLAIPILPGTLFLIPGLLLWSTEFRWAKRLLVRIRRWISARTDRRTIWLGSASPPERDSPETEQSG